MRSRSLFIATSVLLVLAVVPGAMAQDEPEPAATENILEWDESPAGFLLTKDEQKEWKKVATEAEARDFIELFWAKRNPDPTSAFNPVKADFENKVRYADEQYTWEKKRGALTDRGRVLILMGAPHYSENRFPTETVERIDDRAVGTDEVRANAKLWFYDPQQLPKEFGIKGSRLVFTFYEEKAESNNFILDRSHQDATMAMRAMSRAPEVYVLNPDLTEVPKPVSIPGGVAPTAAQLAWLDAESAPLDDRLLAVAEVGVADPGNRPLWLHLELPADAPVLDVLVGRVSATDGVVGSTFQIPAKAMATTTGRAYHLTFPLNPGSYKIEVAGAAGGAAQIIWSDEVVIPPTPTEGTWMTPLMFSLSVVKEDEWQLGSPFGYGALHLMPLTATALPSQTELSYFGHVIHPGLNEAGEPELEVKVTLKMDGQRLGRPLIIPLPTVAIVDGLYVYANSINLAALPQTGTYKFEFKVTDKISEVSVERDVELDITVE
jgi:GWxTD domain-containing protein